MRHPSAPIVMLGMVSEDSDHGDYGWILPSPAPTEGPRAVLSFVEKPDPQRSRELAAAGALVNSFIFTSRGRTLVGLYEEAVPELLRPFVGAILAGSQNGRLRELYELIPCEHDFSRAVAGGLPRLARGAPCPALWLVLTSAPRRGSSDSWQGHRLGSMLRLLRRSV